MTQFDREWVKGLQNRIEKLEELLLSQCQENIGLCMEIDELKRRLAKYEQTNQEKDSQEETDGHGTRK